MNRAVHFIRRLTLTPQVVRVVSSFNSTEQRPAGFLHVSGVFSLGNSMWAGCSWHNHQREQQLQSNGRWVYFYFWSRSGSVWKNNNKKQQSTKTPSLCWEEDSRQHMHTPAHNINILQREWGAFCVPLRCIPLAHFLLVLDLFTFFHLGWEWEFMVYCCWLDTAATAAGKGNGGSDTATKVIGRNTNLFSCFSCYSYGFCLPSRRKVNLQIWKGNH